MRRAVVVVLLVACGGATPAAKKPEVTDLSAHLPATLAADHPKEGDPRAVHVRVWADADVRQRAHWKDEIGDAIDGANQLLTPLCGVKLVADDVKDWDRPGNVRDALDRLVQTDDAHDVTWVIGFVGANKFASKAMAELGQAKPLGHYVVLHAWADQPETAALARDLAGLTPAQRTEVIGAHRHHEQAVVLLHFLARTLGAIAEADPTQIEYLSYSAKQTTFSDRNRELLQLGLDMRLADDTDPQIAHDLVEAIQKADWGGWVPSDHDAVIAALGGVVKAGQATKTAADVPQAAVEELDRIRELGKRGQIDDALHELDNLLIAYPASATMHELKCELMLAKPGVASDKTRAACARTAELAPGDPNVYFAVGEALVKAGDLAGAHAQLAQAAARIPNLKAAQDEAWHRLVAIYGAMGALTWAEETIAAGKLDKDPLAAEIATQRARYGLRKGAKIRPEAEPAALAASHTALDLVYAGKYGDAARTIAAGEKKWPAAAGLEAARCDLELREGRPGDARAACARAIAIDPDESWALYLAAVIQLKDESPASTQAAIGKLKKAIDLDPTLGQAWRALGRAYAERTKDSAAFDQLAKDYQTRFGQPLPQ
ncbi:MAG TPA: tetratricopeptide repeat protein [Kofleriaceae bacterium]|jgi:tetratricopeptide (TPR) repeat protein